MAEVKSSSGCGVGIDKNDDSAVSFELVLACQLSTGHASSYFRLQQPWSLEAFHSANGPMARGPKEIAQIQCILG